MLKKLKPPFRDQNYLDTCDFLEFIRWSSSIFSAGCMIYTYTVDGMCSEEIERTGVDIESDGGKRFDPK